MPGMNEENLKTVVKPSAEEVKDELCADEDYKVKEPDLSEKRFCSI